MITTYFAFTAGEAIDDLIINTYYVVQDIMGSEHVIIIVKMT